MRRIRLDWTTTSTGALVGAMLVFVATTFGAIRGGTLPRVDVARHQELVPVDFGPRDSVTLSRLSADPFRAGRGQAAWSEGASAPAATARAETPALLGTVVRGDSSFALCQLAGEAPRIVRLQDRVGALTLVSIEPGRAVFASAAGDRIALTLSTPEAPR